MATFRFGASGRDGRYRAMQGIKHAIESHVTSIENTVLFRGMIRQPPDLSNREAETASAEVLEAAVRRRPGRPKGLPKPEGSGRQPGTPNRVTKDIREAAGKHGPKALAALVKLLGNPDPKIVATAAREVLDRAYGKPVSPTEISGPDGSPLVPAPVITDFDLANLTLFLLSKSADAAGEQLPHARKPSVIAQKADPFATQRAEQATEIAKALPPEHLTETVWSDPWKVQQAERDLAIAERRPERPAPVYVNPTEAQPWRYGDDSATRPQVVRFRPR